MSSMDSLDYSQLATSLALVTQLNPTATSTEHILHSLLSLCPSPIDVPYEWNLTTNSTARGQQQQQIPLQPLRLTSDERLALLSCLRYVASIPPPSSSSSSSPRAPNDGSSSSSSGIPPLSDDDQTAIKRILALIPGWIHLLAAVTPLSSSTLTNYGTNIVNNKGIMNDEVFAYEVVSLAVDIGSAYGVSTIGIAIATVIEYIHNSTVFHEHMDQLRSSNSSGTDTGSSFFVPSLSSSSSLGPSFGRESLTRTRTIPNSSDATKHSTLSYSPLPILCGILSAISDSEDILLENSSSSSSLFWFPVVPLCDSIHRLLVYCSEAIHEVSKSTTTTSSSSYLPGSSTNNHHRNNRINDDQSIGTTNTTTTNPLEYLCALNFLAMKAVLPNHDPLSNSATLVRTSLPHTLNHGNSAPTEDNRPGNLSDTASILPVMTILITAARTSGYIAERVCTEDTNYVLRTAAVELLVRVSLCIPRSRAKISSLIADTLRGVLHKANNTVRSYTNSGTDTLPLTNEEYQGQLLLIQTILAAIVLLVRYGLPSPFTVNTSSTSSSSFPAVVATKTESVSVTSTDIPPPTVPTTNETKAYVINSINIQLLTNTMQTVRTAIIATSGGTTNRKRITRSGIANRLKGINLAQQLQTFTNDTVSYPGNPSHSTGKKTTSSTVSALKSSNLDGSTVSSIGEHNDDTNEGNDDNLRMDSSGPTFPTLLRSILVGSLCALMAVELGVQGGTVISSYVSNDTDHAVEVITLLPKEGSNRYRIPPQVAEGSAAFEASTTVSIVYEVVRELNSSRELSLPEANDTHKRRDTTDPNNTSVSSSSSSTVSIEQTKALNRSIALVQLLCQIATACDHPGITALISGALVNTWIQEKEIDTIATTDTLRKYKLGLPKLPSSMNASTPSTNHASTTDTNTNGSMFNRFFGSSTTGTAPNTVTANKSSLPIDTSSSSSSLNGKLTDSNDRTHFRSVLSAGMVRTSLLRSASTTVYAVVAEALVVRYSKTALLYNSLALTNNESLKYQYNELGSTLATLGQGLRTVPAVIRQEYRSAMNDKQTTKTVRRRLENEVTALESKRIDFRHRILVLVTQIGSEISKSIMNSVNNTPSPNSLGYFGTVMGTILPTLAHALAPVPTLASSGNPNESNDGITTTAPSTVGSFVAIPYLIAASYSIPQRSSTASVRMYRSLWTSLVAGHFTDASEKLWPVSIYRAVKAIAANTPVLVVRSTGSHFDGDLTAATSMKVPFSDTVITEMRNYLVTVLPEIRDSLTTLPAHQLLFIRATYALETLRASTGVCKAPLLYLHDASIEREGLGHILLAISDASFRSFITQLLRTGRSAERDSIFRDHALFYLARCAHRFPRVRNACFRYLVDMVDRFPQLLWDETVLHALLDSVEVLSRRAKQGNDPLASYNPYQPPNTNRIHPNGSLSTGTKTDASVFVVSSSSAVVKDASSDPYGESGMLTISSSPYAMHTPSAQTELADALSDLTELACQWMLRAVVAAPSETRALFQSFLTRLAHSAQTVMHTDSRGNTMKNNMQYHAGVHGHAGLTAAMQGIAPSATAGSAPPVLRTYGMVARVRQAGLTILGRTPNSLTAGLNQLAIAHAHVRWTGVGSTVAATTAASATITGGGNQSTAAVANVNAGTATGGSSSNAGSGKGTGDSAAVLATSSSSFAVSPMTATLGGFYATTWATTSLARILENKNVPSNGYSTLRGTGLAAVSVIDEAEEDDATSVSGRDTGSVVSRNSGPLPNRSGPALTKPPVTRGSMVNVNASSGATVTSTNSSVNALASSLGLTYGTATALVASVYSLDWGKPYILYNTIDPLSLLNNQLAPQFTIGAERRAHFLGQIEGMAAFHQNHAHELTVDSGKENITFATNVTNDLLRIGGLLLTASQWNWRHQVAQQLGLRPSPGGKTGTEEGYRDEDDAAVSIVFSNDMLNDILGVVPASAIPNYATNTVIPNGGGTGNGTRIKRLKHGGILVYGPDSDSESSIDSSSSSSSSSINQTRTSPRGTGKGESTDDMTKKRSFATAPLVPKFLKSRYSTGGDAGNASSSNRSSRSFTKLTNVFRSKSTPSKGTSGEKENTMNKETTNTSPTDIATKPNHERSPSSPKAVRGSSLPRHPTKTVTVSKPIRSSGSAFPFVPTLVESAVSGLRTAAVHQLRHRGTVATDEEVSTIIYRIAALLVWLHNRCQNSGIDMVQHQQGSLTYRHNTKEFDASVDTLLPLLVWLPVRTFTNATLQSATECWTWILAAVPTLRVRLLSEIFAAWQWTIQLRFGFFAGEQKDPSVDTSGTDASRTAPDVSSSRMPVDLLTPPVRQNPIGDNSIPGNHATHLHAPATVLPSSLRNLEPHTIWIKFLEERFRIIRSRNGEELGILVSIVQAALQDYTRLSTHPASFGLRVRFLHLSMCILHAAHYPDHTRENQNQRWNHGLMYPKHRSTTEPSLSYVSLGGVGAWNGSIPGRDIALDRYADNDDDYRTYGNESYRSLGTGYDEDTESDTGSNVSTSFSSSSGLPVDTGSILLCNGPWYLNKGTMHAFIHRAGIDEYGVVALTSRNAGLTLRTQGYSGTLTATGSLMDAWPSVMVGSLTVLRERIYRAFLQWFELPLTYYQVATSTEKLREDFSYIISLCRLVQADARFLFSSDITNTNIGNSNANLRSTDNYRSIDRNEIPNSLSPNGKLPRPPALTPRSTPNGRQLSAGSASQLANTSSPDLRRLVLRRLPVVAATATSTVTVGTSFDAKDDSLSVLSRSPSNRPSSLLPIASSSNLFGLYDIDNDASPINLAYSRTLLRRTSSGMLVNNASRKGLTYHTSSHDIFRLMAGFTPTTNAVTATPNLTVPRNLSRTRIDSRTGFGTANGTIASGNDYLLSSTSPLHASSTVGLMALRNMRELALLLMGHEIDRIVAWHNPLDTEERRLNDEKEFSFEARINNLSASGTVPVPTTGTNPSATPATANPSASVSGYGSSTHSSSVIGKAEWNRHTATAWAIHPRLALAVWHRFGRLKEITVPLAQYVAMDPAAVRDDPYAVRLIITPEAIANDSPQLRQLLVWSPTSMPVILDLLARCSHYDDPARPSASPAVAHPLVAAYIVRCLGRFSPDTIVFYLPQLVQALRHDATGALSDFLFETSQTSMLVAHQLIWLLVSESKSSDDNDKHGTGGSVSESLSEENYNDSVLPFSTKTNKSNASGAEGSSNANSTAVTYHGFQHNLRGTDPLPSRAINLMLRIVATFPPTAKAMFELQYSFWDHITNISGRLKTEVADKSLRKTKIREFLKDLQREAERDYYYAKGRIARAMQEEFKPGTNTNSTGIMGSTDNSIVATNLDNGPVNNLSVSGTNPTGTGSSSAALPTTALVTAATMPTTAPGKRPLPLAGAIKVLGGNMNVAPKLQAGTTNPLALDIGTTEGSGVNTGSNAATNVSGAAHVATNASASSLPSTAHSSSLPATVSSSKEQMIEIARVATEEAPDIIADIYMPTDPYAKVVAVEMDSGRAMQSAAKCPFMLTFVVEPYAGPDATLRRMQRKEVRRSRDRARLASGVRKNKYGSHWKLRQTDDPMLRAKLGAQHAALVMRRQVQKQRVQMGLTVKRAREQVSKELNRQRKELTNAMAGMTKNMNLLRKHKSTDTTNGTKTDNPTDADNVSIPSEREDENILHEDSSRPHSDDEQVITSSDDSAAYAEADDVRQDSDAESDDDDDKRSVPEALTANHPSTQGTLPPPVPSPHGSGGNDKEHKKRLRDRLGLGKIAYPSLRRRSNAKNRNTNDTETNEDVEGRDDNENTTGNGKRRLRGFRLGRRSPGKNSDETNAVDMANENPNYPLEQIDEANEDNDDDETMDTENQPSLNPHTTERFLNATVLQIEEGSSAAILTVNNNNSANSTFTNATNTITTDTNDRKRNSGNFASGSRPKLRFGGMSLMNSSTVSGPANLPPNLPPAGGSALTLPDHLRKVALSKMSCIFKVYDDCRQDALAIQVIQLFKTVFETAQIGLFLYPYRVIPTRTGSKKAPGGILECVPDVRSRDEIGKAGFPTLFDYFVSTYGRPEGAEFEVARRNMIRSLAAYGIVCYILRIKDRHNGNLLVTGKGHLVHIDFGFLLGISPGGNLGFETAAFKLTQEMVDIMGGTTDTEMFQYFTELTCRAFLLARNHMDTVHALVAGMADSGLPCFLFPDTLVKLWNRFRPDDSDLRACRYMREETLLAAKSMTTVLYDGIQKLQNNIHSETWQ